MCGLSGRGARRACGGSGGGERGRTCWRFGGAGGFERRAICVVQDRDGVMRVLENIAYVIVVYAWHLTYIRGALSNKHSKEKGCK